MRCCTGRWRGRSCGWWSSVAALRGEAANHRKVHWLKTVVLSVAGKGVARLRQVWAKKANASELLMTCRKGIGDIKTEGCGTFGMSLGVTRLLLRWCPA